MPRGPDICSLSEQSHLLTYGFSDIDLASNSRQCSSSQVTGIVAQRAVRGGVERHVQRVMNSVRLRHVLVCKMDARDESGHSNKTSAHRNASGGAPGAHPNH